MLKGFSQPKRKTGKPFNSSREISLQSCLPSVYLQKFRDLRANRDSSRQSTFSCSRTQDNCHSLSSYFSISIKVLNSFSQKRKIVPLVLDLNHLRLSRDFYLISAHKQAQKNFQIFFQLYLTYVLRSKAMEDPMKNHYHLSLVLNLNKFCDESFCDFFLSVHCHHYSSRRP